jgi:two-component system, LuxR family, sensor kinase FixL
MTLKTSSFTIIFGLETTLHPLPEGHRYAYGDSTNPTHPMSLVDLHALTQPGLLPHGICLSWKPGLLLLHVTSDALIALAYFSIPFGLAHFVSRRKDLQYRWMFILFAAFILACGTTHLLDIWTLWHPDYALQGTIKAITALISVASAILLWPVIGKALRLPSPKELARINTELQQEIRSRQQTLLALEREAKERQQLEARLQAILDTTVEGILSINAEGQIELANQAARHMFNNSIPGDCSVRIDDLVRISSATNPENEYVLNAILSNEEIALQGIRADGSYFPIEASAGISGSSHSTQPLYTCVVRDVTEKKMTEQLVREKEARLKQQESQLLMIQRQNTAGELAAMVSHEINQPLGAITNYLGGISLRYETVLNQNPELQDTLQETLRLAKRTSEIVQGIRNLVRRRADHAAEVDMKELIDETLSLLNAELGRKSIKLRTTYDKVTSKVWGEKIQLQQLFLNLFLNAMDALEEVTEDSRTLDITLQQSNPTEITLMIQDNGKGFKPSEAKRIFDPFYTTKESGIGLGLSICKSVVETHGGDIRAKTRATGTQFIVNLPCVGEQHV